MQGGSGANGHVHHPKKAACAYHTVLLANEVAVLFFLAHAATIYRGAAFVLHMLLVSSSRFSFGLKFTELYKKY